MWLIFDSIEFNPNLVSRTGTKYGAWVLKGKRKGYNGEEDSPYEKKFFDNQATTIIEHGIPRPNCSIVQFFQKGVVPGDVVKIKFVRNGQRWDVESMEPLAKTAPTYEPLTESEVEKLKASQVAAVNFAEMQTSQRPPWVTSA